MKRILSMVVLGLLAGCATPYQTQKTTQGAAIGATAGAIIGSQSDQFVGGAIIGGVLGGLAGAILSDGPDGRNDRVYASAPRYHRKACGRGDIYFERARHARELNRRISLMRQGIRFCPNNPAAQNDLGVALMLWGDSSGARIHFNQALRFDPQYHPARRNMEFMRHYRAPARYRQHRQPPVYRQPPQPAPRERIEHRRGRQDQMRERQDSNNRSDD